MTIAATHLPSAKRIPIAHTARAFSNPSRPSFMTSPTVPEKKPMARARADGFGTTESDAMGALVTVSRVGRAKAAMRWSSRLQGTARDRRSALADLRSYARTQPIFCAMLFWAPMHDFRAGIQPEPFVERTHAAPRSCQTLDICGMLGIGTPPAEAAPNAFRALSLTCASAFKFAGDRSFASASVVCAAGCIM